MSDEQTIGAIKERNEERLKEINLFGHGRGTRSMQHTWSDIDTLLSEIEARDAEIERLRAEVLEYALLFIAISDNLPEGFAADDLASESRLAELAEFYIQGELRSR